MYVLILCNYPCTGRHTKKEANVVLILKELALPLGGCFSVPRVHQDAMGSKTEMQTPWHLHSHAPLDQVHNSVRTGPGSLHF